MNSSIRHVVLLGLMGVGKTTVGRWLAESLGWPLSDSDEAIAKKCGSTVRELNERLGTDGMHRLEAEHLLEALEESRPSVISAAASVVEDSRCRQALEADGIYGVWLQGRAETLAARFAAQPHRPVFDPDTEAVFRRQLSERSRWFAEVARHWVSVDGRTPREIVDDIMRALQPDAAPTILIHGGAGALGAELRERRDELTEALSRVLDRSGQRLQAGEDAVAVASGAVRDLEDCEHFNAGYGAALCSDGSVELSASLMRGSDQAAGAVAGLRLVRNPILAAGIVLESHQVLMIGERADELALAHGAERWDNDAFVTERQRARLRASGEAKAENRGTVGAVCLDAQGRLAAATSTGGVTGQPPGRVGDSPLIGAGTWADKHAAASCTGDGEFFIRAGVARWLAAMVAQGAELQEAAARALAEVGRLGGEGGLIALDSRGRASLPFSTEAMPRGIWRSGSSPEVHLD